MPVKTTCSVCFAMALAVPAVVSAAEEPEPQKTDIIVYGRALEQIGIARSGSEGTVGYRDFDARPLLRVGELAETVPGLIATQHSGAGKANQYFLRGFNLDHGTDLAGFVDGAPINMRSHGHGQGYLDLSFVIPELIERIDYQKGPYRVENGDFSAAGSLSLTTKASVAAPIADVTIGSFGYRRALIAASTALGNGSATAAFDATINNGPWVLDEALEAYKGLIKYSSGTATNGWSLGIAGYSARWTSTDQVPERAITSGIIDRFGNIDDRLTNRSSRFAITYARTTPRTDIAAYAILSRLLLTSNFTYFLDDPVNGDQFQQRDQRTIYGGRVRHSVPIGERVRARVGIETRFDDIGKVALYRSTAGVRRAVVREDAVKEYSGAVFGEVEWAVGPGVRIVAGLRGDLIGYDVTSDLAVNSGAGSDAILAPKLALAWQPADKIEVYANYGESYHSNDVRGAAISLDPASGDPADPVPVISRARGSEVGVRFETADVIASIVGFYLELGSELVFVGDAGTTEPSDGSRRYGTELSLFWKPTRTIAIDASAALTNARFRDVPVTLRRIPGSVSRVLAGGITADLGAGISASARVRHFGSAPLIEDGSVFSEPTTIVNFGGYLTRGRFRLGLDVLNVFDTKDADISYFYPSRLPGEASDGVADRHIHPVEPRQLRVTLRASL